MFIKLGSRVGRSAPCSRPWAITPIILSCFVGCARPPDPEKYGVAEQTGSGGENQPVETLTVSVNHGGVDVLFVIDNSGSMSEEQANLVDGIERFIAVLERPGAELDYHIGFTTTDNGNPWCQGTGPEAGKLRLLSCRSRSAEFVFEGSQTIDATQEACFDFCPAEWTNIEISPSAIGPGTEEAPRNWIEDVNGQTNLPEGLSTVQAFQCFAPQGIDGCGFESPLESMHKALTRSVYENETQFGFIRDNAILSIIHVTDEADCSYNPDHETIFLPNGARTFWSDQMSPAPSSAVCWNAGVACSSSSPYETCEPADRDETGNAVASADAAVDAVLLPISRYIDKLQEIEGQKQRINPEQHVLVSILSGVNSDGTVTYQDSTEDEKFQNDFGIGPGCSSSAGEAIPPVRLRALVEAFQVADQRNAFSICDADHGPALEAIAESIVSQIHPPCISACLADVECDVFYELGSSAGETIPIPRCEDTGGATMAEPLCHEIITESLSSECRDAGWNAELSLSRFDRDSLPSDAAVKVTCTLAEESEPPCSSL